MKLSKVLSNVDTKGEYDDIEIEGLYHNSKEVKDGGLFFAIDGTKVSGREFALEAVKRGAKVIISSSKIEGLPSEVINLVSEDTRLAMSLCASNFYEEPSRDMFVLGVTGTNGKTTTTFMLESVFKEAGNKVGVIGTNGVFIDGKKIDSNLTTPDPIYLQKTLAKMREEGVDVVAMEVSAHALELKKTRGVMTDIALFTNLTQDHLDFFSNMQSYGEAKAKLFEEGMSRFGVVNIDDSFGRYLQNAASVPILTYSQKKESGADIIADKVRHNTTNQTFDVITPKGRIKITLNLCGGFNISNALGVIAAALMSGIELGAIKKGLEKLEMVEGRFNTYDVNGVRVVIDYAHTPDGLMNILSATREITSGKLISVFGCGGNRDRGKRPIMGEISEKLADYTIVTSDNPRFEKPEDIANDILEGMKTSSHLVSLDRKKAIKLAVAMANEGDSVVIAGKGAEPYIDMLGVKTPYEDKKVVEEILEEIKNKE